LPEWLHRDRFFLAMLLLIAGCLLFARLDDRFLWQDEAETALLAQSVLIHGVPTAFDGRNLISQEGQQEFEAPDYRWFWTPWLQHYVTAASFAVLGPSTWSARFPFVLFALGTLLLCYVIAFEISHDLRVARLASLILMTNVPFLLHARQCRYYAPACFFGSLLVWQYLRALEERRGALLGLAIAATGLFHSHYVVCAGFVLGLAIHFVFTDRRRVILMRFAIAGVATVLLALPYLLGFFARGSGQAVPGLDRSLASLGEAVYHINRFVFPLLLPLAVGGMSIVWWLWDRKQAGADAAKMADPAACKQVAENPSGRVRGGLALWLVGLVSVGLLVTVMPWFFFRYYVALIPIAAIGQALLLGPILRTHSAVGLLCAFVLLATDGVGRALPIPHEVPLGSVRHMQTGDEDSGKVVGRWAHLIPMAGYLFEITHDHVGPLEAVVKYLREHAKKEETIIATYGDLPLQFYTDLKVVGGLSAENPTPYVKADWLLVRAHTHRSGDGRLKRFIAQNLERDRYEVMGLEALDVPYENRPDPIYHKYRQPSEGPPPVKLWRRISSAPSEPNEPAS